MHLSRLRRWGLKPNEVILSALVGICGRPNRIDHGMGLHCFILKQGFQDHHFIASSLVVMYSKCARVDSARRFFEERAVYDCISWNSMISAYLRNGMSKEAIDLFSDAVGRVSDRLALVNNFTLSSVLKACALSGSIRPGRSVHGLVVKLDFEWDVVLAGSLMTMYSKHGCLGRARLIFEKLGERDLVAWNAMISGYVQFSHDEEAMKLFQRMQLEGFLPNEITLTSVLKASAGLEDIDLGKCLHAYVTKRGHISDSFAGTALVDMYSKCSEIKDAEHAFMVVRGRSLVSFNALISGYCLMGDHERAMLAYINLLKQAMRPDPLTLTGLLCSCSSKALGEGSQAHCHAIKLGFDSDISLGNSLVGFYAKCGLTDCAVEAFGSVIEPNSVAWAGIISCLVKNDEGEKALQYFKTMHMFWERADEFSTSAVIKVLADWAAAEQGKHLHTLVIKMGLESAVFVATGLVDMYCKCGMVEDSFKVFVSMSLRNDVAWNVMITGLGHNGRCTKSLELFHEMVDIGVTPNAVTFIGVLAACNHAGLVDEGRSYFDLMGSRFGISPSIEHYTCMVSLLARTGRFHEAELLMNACSSLPDPVMWRSFLASCRVRRSEERPSRASKERLLSAPDVCSSSYVLLSNLFAEEGLWPEVAEIRSSMRELGMSKEPGCSWIAVRNETHVFTAEQKSGFPDHMRATLFLVHSEMRAGG
ncbi:unnamed protein product [Spirodela intermedia]|uniref:Uncharacterized protein n=1 Tax=Spirodela intermedia TaxID=51605 RepID=A0A7I8KYH6_SPIIN|nr:unnamed protein product [Spirodela intermedia]